MKWVRCYLERSQGCPYFEIPLYFKTFLHQVITLAKLGLGSVGLLQLLGFQWLCYSFQLNSSVNLAMVHSEVPVMTKSQKAWPKDKRLEKNYYLHHVRITGSTSEASFSFYWGRTDIFIQSIVHIHTEKLHCRGDPSQTYCHQDMCFWACLV